MKIDSYIINLSDVSMKAFSPNPRLFLHHRWSEITSDLPPKLDSLFTEAKEKSESCGCVEKAFERTQRDGKQNIKSRITFF